MSPASNERLVSGMNSTELKEGSRDWCMNLVGFTAVNFSSIPKESIGCWKSYHVPLVLADSYDLDGSASLTFDLKMPLSLVSSSFWILI